MVILALFLVATVVYYIVTDIELMKKGVNSVSKREIYSSILFTQWALVGILIVFWALIDIPYEQLVFIDAGKNTISWIQNSNLMWGFIGGAALSVIVLPLVMKSDKPNPSLEKIDFMLPKTKIERVTFFFIAVTAGVCEEIIFRGAATYFFMNVSFELPMWAVGVCGALLFGLAHWYQGLSGIVTTSILGYALFLIYVQTGSLLIPIILHFLIDVKFVFMPEWRKGQQLKVDEGI